MTKLTPNTKISFSPCPVEAIDHSILSVILSDKKDKYLELEGHLVVDRVGYWLDTLADGGLIPEDLEKLHKHLARVQMNIIKDLPDAYVADLVRGA